MNNLEKYNEIFIETFGVDEESLNSDFISGQVDSWDSIGHMNLLAAIEEEFDITLADEDLMEFQSYDAGKEILKKYNINFE
ncbi:MAG: acyl carrier protein [Lachnospiraceae bacterium]|nr:acyl carrier protein [Lachnospiraceae bacterium]